MSGRCRRAPAPFRDVQSRPSPPCRMRAPNCFRLSDCSQDRCRPHRNPRGFRTARTDWMSECSSVAPKINVGSVPLRKLFFRSRRPLFIVHSGGISRREKIEALTTPAHRGASSPQKAGRECGSPMQQSAFRSLPAAAPLAARAAAIIAMPAPLPGAAVAHVLHVRHRGIEVAQCGSARRCGECRRGSEESHASRGDEGNQSSLHIGSPFCSTESMHSHPARRRCPCERRRPKCRTTARQRIAASTMIDTPQAATLVHVGRCSRALKGRARWRGRFGGFAKRSV